MRTVSCGSPASPCVLCALDDPLHAERLAEEARRIAAAAIVPSAPRIHKGRVTLWGDQDEVPGAPEMRAMFGMLLAGFLGSWVGFVWSAGLLTAPVEEFECLEPSPPVEVPCWEDDIDELTPESASDTGLAAFELSCT